MQKTRLITQRAPAMLQRHTAIRLSLTSTKYAAMWMRWNRLLMITFGQCLSIVRCFSFANRTKSKEARIKTAGPFGSAVFAFGGHVNYHPDRLYPLKIPPRPSGTLPKLGGEKCMSESGLIPLLIQEGCPHKAP